MTGTSYVIFFPKTETVFGIVVNPTLPLRSRIAPGTITPSVSKILLSATLTFSLYVMLITSGAEYPYVPFPRKYPFAACFMSFPFFRFNMLSGRFWTSFARTKSSTGVSPPRIDVEMPLRASLVA